MTKHQAPGQHLPCDLEAERTVLASILVDSTQDKASLSACLKAKLDPSAFFEPKHQLIYLACQKVAEEGALPDELTITNNLRTSLQLDLAGGVTYINELTGLLFSPSPNLPKAISIVRDKLQARQLVYLARELSAKAISGVFSPAELAASIQAQTKLILEASKPTADTTQRMELDELCAFDRFNDPNSLVGKRWLCKGGSLLFSGQAGAGKSTLLTQLCISWALGRELWGMKPVRPLRMLILQSENDGGDLGEQMQDCLRAMQLTPTDNEHLRERVFIYREAVKTGEAFGTLLEELITTHQIDCAVVDPLLGFSGGDISKQEFCSHFLRQILQPILMRTGCCLIAGHHQNKPPRKKEDQNSMQSTYDFTGSSELANWFRSTAILRREDPELPHFIFKLGKRGNRAGMKDKQGNFTESLRIRHSKTRGEIKWEINDLPPPDQEV
jgi:hypothetical protein